MAELAKVKRSLAKHDPNAPQEILLVVDATTGSNALAQAKQFHEAIGLTGLIVTKLDGSGKGGVVVAIQDELGIPTRFVGTGEKLDDFAEFDGRDFVAKYGVVENIQSVSEVHHSQSNGRAGRDRRSPSGSAGCAVSSAKFTVLKGAQRELWLTFLIKFLIYTAYSVTNKTMVLWLSKDLGFSDQARGSVGRLGLGAGDDGVHVARRLADRCDRFAAHFFPRRRHLHGRAQRDGRRRRFRALALACGVLAAGGRRGARHAGVARGDAVLFDHGAALDLVLHHLHGDECRLLRRGIDFRFRPATAISIQLLWLCSQPRISSFSSLVSRSRSCFSRQFIFSAAAPTERRDNAVVASTAMSGRIGETVRQSAAETIQLFRRLIGQSAFYRAARFLSPHRISQSHLSPDGLRLPEVRRSRARTARAGRETRRQSIRSSLFSWCRWSAR